MRALPLLAAVAVACGHEPPAPAPPRPASAPPAALTADPARPDDAVVATVDGAPIRASCVEGQLARGGTTVAAAVAACVDVELMAREAARRGLGASPEVVAATRVALVDALIAREFTAKVQRAEDLPSVQFQRTLEANLFRLDRPELRASFYVRIRIPPALQGTPGEARLGAAAAQLATALGPEIGLMPPHVLAAATRIAGAAGVAFESNPFELRAREGLLPAYGDALFAIPEVGRIAPAFRTRPPEPPGWDIVLLTELQPARTLTRDELVAEMFPDLRRSYFGAWVDAVARAAGIRVARVAATIEQLDREAP
jgi:hypothetical protein